MMKLDRSNEFQWLIEKEGSTGRKKSRPVEGQFFRTHCLSLLGIKTRMKWMEHQRIENSDRKKKRTGWMG